MMDKQTIINQMLSGNETVISDSINSDSAIIALNAIISGTRYRVKSAAFIDGVKNISKNSTDKIMELPLKKYAIASLHIMGEERYDGNDEVILRFIQSRFEK